VDAIVNWIWQGSVVALGAGALLRVWPPSRAQARYAALWAALAVVLALPAVPLVWAAAAGPSGSDAASSTVPFVSMPVAWWTSTTLAIGLWLAWCIVSAARGLTAALALRDEKRRCLPLPQDREARLRHWTQVRTLGRQTRVVLSDQVESAAVLGCGSPVVAVAPVLLDRLDDADLDRVVIHEWAHVQRHDDVAKVVQLVFRLAAGWHPAVWYLERQLDSEREAACDDTVVAVTGSARAYAACLATLASLRLSRLPSPPVVAVASSGLRRRIVRILAGRQVAAARSWRVSALGAGMVLGALAMAVGGLQVVRTAALPLDGLRVASTAPARPPVAAVASRLVPGEHALTVRARTGPSNRRAPDERDDRVARRVDALTTVAAVQTQQPAPTMGRLEPQTEPHDLLAAEPVVRVEELQASAGTLAAVAMGPSIADAQPARNVKGTAFWTAAADAGTAIGRRSEKAALGTAGFFTRFGKKIAGSF
jgi:beta-lactamase regulating signal transducer with metallopeptidase domain